MDGAIKRARYLRKEQTFAEALLWSRLRNRALGGYKFKRQVPMEQYIVDFACHSPGLVIELDGEWHTFRSEFDQKRTKLLETLGYKVKRFSNNEVLQNINLVLIQISHELKLLSPHPDPLPKERE